MFGSAPFGGSDFGHAEGPPNQFSGSAVGDSDASVILTTSTIGEPPGAAIPPAIWNQIVKGQLKKKRRQQVRAPEPVFPIKLLFAGAGIGEGRAQSKASGRTHVRALGRCRSRGKGKAVGRFAFRGGAVANSQATGSSFYRSHVRAAPFFYDDKQDEQDALAAILLLI